MRMLAVWLASFVIVSSAAAGPAQAARKPRAPAQAVAVVTGERELREAIELELELLPTARVRPGRAIEADLKKGGEAALAPKALARAMKRRQVEVLVRVEERDGGLRLVAYGADGRPRLLEKVARGADDDETAAALVEALKPALARWRARKPLPASALEDDGEPEAAEAPARAEKGRDGAAGKPKPGKTSDEKLFLDPDAVEDEGGEGPGRALAEGGSPPADPPRPQKRRADAAEDDERPARRRRSVADVEEQVERGPPPERPRTTHLFAVSGSFDGATWQYAFTGANPAQSTSVGAAFYPGGSARLDFWPLPWVGIDAEGQAAAVQFRILDDEALPIRPNEFTATDLGFAAALKARYVLTAGLPGFAIGARVGYRYWGSLVQPQVNEVDEQNLTVVPGYELHALSVGPEFYLPLVVADRRLELELKADVLPATRYAEQPDNPGATSVAFGWAASLGARYDVFSGFFVEALARTVGAAVTFEGEGDRRTALQDPATGERVKVQGGSALNYTAGFSIGIGFFY